jgi:hypothetical protein
MQTSANLDLLCIDNDAHWFLEFSGEGLVSPEGHTLVSTPENLDQKTRDSVKSWRLNLTAKDMEIRASKIMDRYPTCETIIE